MAAQNPWEDDELLVHASLQGDDAAFSELVRRHKSRIFAMASRFGRDGQQIEDIAQETFIRAYRKLADFRGDAPFEHWLSRIAVRACYDFLRRHRRIRLETPIDSDAAAARPDGAQAASQSGADAREIIALAMARLSPDERLILTLMELEEKTVKETSALTGWSEANVKVRAHRARRALRSAVEGLGE